MKQYDELKQQKETAPRLSALTDADAVLAAELLERYRTGKSRLDSRLCDEAEWWQSRCSGVPAGNTRRGTPPVSAWL